MAQLFSLGAKSFLQAPITATDTSLLITAALADLFPVANTGVSAVNTPSLDWFKIILENTLGQKEVVYVRTRASGSATLSDMIRGQEGTTARAFTASNTVVGHRSTAADAQAAAELPSIATTFGKSMLAAGSVAAQRTLLSVPSKAEIQAQSSSAFTATGTATAYVLTTSPAAPTLAADQRYQITWNVTSGLTPTLTRDGLAARNIKVYNAAGAKITPPIGSLVAGVKNDVVDDGVDFVVLNPLVPVAQILGNSVCDFRLSLTTNLPITTGDVTGATTIYAIPYIGKYIDLFDGTSTWNRRASAQFSLALGTLTSGLPHDVFCYDNATVPTLEFTAWTNSTTRATALAYQDGVLVKSGATTRRYLGSFYTTATTTTEDSAAKRYLFNYYNRRPRFMERKEPTASWSYAVATWRQANGSTSNQLNFLVGVVEDHVSANLLASVAPGNTFRMAAGVGLNSTTSPTGIFGSAKTIGSSSSMAEHVLDASFKGMPVLGLNYLAWLEWTDASHTMSVTGVYAASNGQNQSGIIGEVMA